MAREEFVVKEHVGIKVAELWEEGAWALIKLYLLLPPPHRVAERADVYGIHVHWEEGRGRGGCKICHLFSLKLKFCEIPLLLQKLNRVGPVDNRPSTN